MKLIKIICFVILAQIVTACGAHFAGIPETPEENQKYFKLGKPYKISGKWYHPKYQPDYVEEGLASWYGPGFHNEYTANGEVFDKYEMTAAHKTLPLPSMVEVTNLENGKSVIVRVNDRGPFVSGRIIDVSKRAAQKLGFHEKGTAHVRVKYLSRATSALFPSGEHPLEIANRENINKTGRALEATRKFLIPEANATEADIKMPPLSKNFQKSNFDKTSTQPAIYVQAGSFTNKNKARELGKKLQKYGKVTIVPIRVKNQDFFRLKLGPFKNESSANKIVKQISPHGFDNALVIIN